MTSSNRNRDREELERVKAYAERVAAAYPWTPERVERAAALLRAFR